MCTNSLNGRWPTLKTAPADQSFGFIRYRMKDMPKPIMLITIKGGPPPKYAP